MRSNGNMKAVRPYRVLDADQRPEFVETRDLPEHDKKPKPAEQAAGTSCYESAREESDRITTWDYRN